MVPTWMSICLNVTHLDEPASICPEGEGALLHLLVDVLQVGRDCRVNDLKILRHETGDNINFFGEKTEVT